MFSILRNEIGNVLTIFFYLGVMGGGGIVKATLKNFTLLC